MIRGWAFAWEETAMVLFPTLLMCIRRARKQRFASTGWSTSTVLASLAKLIASDLNQRQQKEESSRTPSCCKARYCRYRPTDSVYHQLSVLTVGFHSRQSGDLVPQSLCLC